MANIDRPNGFRPVMHLNGNPYNGASRKYYSPSDNLFIGDVVEADGTGNADGYPTVGRAEASDVIQGVVVGWEVNPDNLANNYHTASATYAVFIADDPDLIFEAQSDDATLVVGSIGLNVNFVVASGATATGLSNMEIDGNTGATTATLPFKIIGFTDREDNDISLTNHRLLVTANNHKNKGGTGTIGL